MQPPPESVIDVQGITKRFGDRTVVDRIDLNVFRGEIFGFLGPNGSGKTTFLRMLCGLLTPDEGTGHCLGHDIRSATAAIKREVGYMTQRFSFYEDLTIQENLDFIARIYAVPDRAQAVRRSLERLGLTWTAANNSPANSPAAGNSGSRSRPASSTTRNSCSSTNRRPGSIPRPGAISGTRSIASPPAVSPS